jgi:hypothetical protein
MDHKVQWKEANIAGGQLTVPVVPTPDERWEQDFAHALQYLNRETRGQQFVRARIEDGELRVDGVNINPEALKLTADFFDVVVQQATGHREREERRFREQNEKLEKDSQDRSAEEVAAAAALRERDDA